MPPLVHPKLVRQDHLQQFFLPWVVPRTIYGCCRWSPWTNYGAVGGPLCHRWFALVTAIQAILGDCCEGTK